jgi:transposase
VVVEKERPVSLFCLRLCYSGASFVWAYERQSQEALQDGHVRAFQYFGGVPGRLAYDYVPRNIIVLMCPVALCGRRASSCPRGLGWWGSLGT